MLINQSLVLVLDGVSFTLVLSIALALAFVPLQYCSKVVDSSPIDFESKLEFFQGVILFFLEKKYPRGSMHLLFFRAPQLGSEANS